MDFQSLVSRDETGSGGFLCNRPHNLLSDSLLDFVTAIADEKQLVMFLFGMVAPDISVEAFDPVNEALLEQKFQ